MGNSAVSAKLSAIHSGFLSAEDYDAMLEKDSVGEICAYLKNTSYCEVLSGVNESNIHRFELENCLKQKLTDEYIRMYNFVGLNTRKMMYYIFLRDEIEFLKAIMRRLFNKEREDLISLQVTDFFKMHSKIDFEAAKMAENMSELVEACRETKYYDELKRADLINSDYFSVSMILDQFYFLSLWRAKEKYIDASEHDDFAYYIGTEIDALNLMWVFRCKRFFKLPNELIYTYTIPVYYHLSRDEMTAVVEAENHDELLRAIGRTRYSYLVESDSESLFIEDNYQHMKHRLNIQYYKSEQNSTGMIFSFFDLRSIELRNIKTIIEGKRYHVDNAVILQHIYIDR